MWRRTLAAFGAIQGFISVRITEHFVAPELDPRRYRLLFGGRHRHNYLVQSVYLRLR
jgi:hypothetical protein